MVAANCWWNSGGARELPPGESYIVTTDAELAQATGGNRTPPTQRQIFDTWTRFSGNTAYEGGNIPADDTSEAANEARSWTYDETTGQVTSTINSNTTIGFVSPETYDYFENDMLVSSVNRDDDVIYAVVAYVKVDGLVNVLAAVRGQVEWNIRAFGANARVLTTGTSLVTPRYPNNNPEGSNAGWSQSGPARIYFKRVGNTVTAITSQFTGNFNANYNNANYPLDSSTAIQYNIPNGSVFAQPGSYGYGALSQNQSTFSNLNPRGGLDASVVYKVNGPNSVQAYEYDQTRKLWAPTARNMWEDLGYPRRITNPVTGGIYYLLGPPEPYSVRRLN